MTKKAYLVPFNSKREIFLHDLRAHSTPDWSFFGEEVAKGETPIKSMIKSAKKKLDLDLSESDVELLGVFKTEVEEEVVERSLYIYRTDQDKFTVKEAAGGHWLSYAGSLKRLEEYEKFDEIWAVIDALLAA